MQRKTLLRALAGEVTERVPIWLMRQAGRYLPEYHETRRQAGGMLALCNAPELAAEVALQPLRRFKLDGCIVFADLPQIAAALGQTLEYHEGEGPRLSPRIRSADDITKTLSLNDLHDRLWPIYETVRRLSARIPADVALIGYAGAPWTVATYMVEGQGGTEHLDLKHWAFSDSGAVQALIELITNATIEYVARQIEAGAEAIQIFESWAGILPEPFFESWCIEPTRRIVDAIHERFPKVPVIAFPRGAGLLYADYAEGTGADAVGLDATVPVQWAAESIQQRLGKCVQGNLDPALLVAGGPAMDREVDRILAALGRGPFVFNLGHGILKQTLPEHVEQLVNRVRDWRG